MMRPSRFLAEIPKDLLQPYHLSQPKPLSSYQRESSFLEVDDRVYHQDFGKGKILKVYNTHMGPGYDVYFFEDQKERSLIARFARLERC